jgi:hypothetical protein
MITKFMLSTQDGERLASREAYMMMHPALEDDCTLVAGDVIELEEGFFILNEDLNPMELATEEQIQRARKFDNA